MTSPVCKCCKNKLINDDKPPRAKVAVDYQEDEPVLICPFCDGDALRLALARESRSTGQ